MGDYEIVSTPSLMDKIYGVSLIIAGGIAFIAGVIAGVAWITFCFGSIIVGVILLFVAPPVLIAPFAIGNATCTVLIVTGKNLMTPIRSYK
jgi:hypothetical protein